MKLRKPIRQPYRAFQWAFCISIVYVMLPGCNIRRKLWFLKVIVVTVVKMEITFKNPKLNDVNNCVLYKSVKYIPETGVLLRIVALNVTQIQTFLF